MRARCTRPCSGGPFIDNRAISAAVAGRCPEEVQKLREAYQREYGADLLEELRRHGSRLKGKTTQLEQLLLREHAELDAQVRVRVSGRTRPIRTDSKGANQLAHAPPGCTDALCI